MSIDLETLVQTMRITAGHLSPVVLMPHEALALIAEVDRLHAQRALDNERLALDSTASRSSIKKQSDVIYRIQYSHDKGATWLNVGGPYTEKEAAVLDAENGRHYAACCGVRYSRVVAVNTDVIESWMT